MISFNLSAQFEQTILSESWSGSGGNSELFYKNTVKTDANKNVYVLGSTIDTNGYSNILIQKFTGKGVLLWQQEYDGQLGLNDMGTALYIDGSNNVYVTGTVTNDTVNGTDIIVLKYSSIGILAWEYLYQGQSEELKDDAATAITGDNLGKIYVAGSSATDSTLYDYLIIAINSSTGDSIWTQTYDYNALGEIPAIIQFSLNPPSLIGKVSIYGASQSSISPNIEWDVARVDLYALNGNITTVSRYTSSSVVGVEAINDVYIDESIYAVGKNYGLTTADDIAIYKLNDDLSLAWEVYYDGHEMGDKARGVKVDSNGNVYVTGYTENAGEGKNIILLKYDSTGDLVWEKEINGIGNGDDEGINLVIDSQNRIFVAANSFENGNFNYKLYGFDSNGEILTSATHDAYQLNDKVEAITIDSDGNILLTGKIQTSSTTFENRTLKYELFTKEFNPVIINGESIFNDNELTICFNSNLINTETIDKKNLKAGKLEDFIDKDLVTLLDYKLGFKSSDLKTFKIYKRLTTADTISITRLGDTIKMEPFWATLSVLMPENSDLDIIIDSLKTLKNQIMFCEKNHFGKLTDIPNDWHFIFYEQSGLKGTYNGIQMVSYDSNVQMIDEGAWEIEVGKPTIKVGVFDSGINWRHEDLGGGTSSTTRVKGGWDYGKGVHPYELANPDPNGHGTKVAGVVGAIRNNEIGVAGIAGGDYENNEEGVSLYSMRMLSDINEVNDSLFDENTIKDAILEGATDNPGTGYGFGLDVLNYSWRLHNGGSDYPIIFHSLRNVINFAYKNDCIQVAASGNAGFGESEDTLFYPASFNDSWLMKTGALCTNSQRCDWSVYDNNLDFVAPGQAGAVYTLVNWDNTSYSYFDGTSAAVPHISGVSSLLLSHHNPEYNNLFPNKLSQEDVEFILQSNAMHRERDPDVSYTNDGPLPQPNIYNGYGLINAYQSLMKTSLPYRVRHFDHVIHIDSSTVIDTLNIIFPEGIDQIPLNAVIGTSYVHLITHTFDHSLPINEDFITGWIRNSTTDLYEYTDSIFNSHWSAAQLESLNSTQATIKGYFYRTEIITEDSTYFEIFPKPSENSTFRIAYSIHTFDTNYNLNQEEISLSNNLIIYPNPTNDKVEISASNNKQYALTVLNITGKVIKLLELNESETLIVDISNFPSGVYLFTFQNEEETIVKKVIKK